MPRNSEVNFYLKHVNASKSGLIFLNFKYSGKRLFFSFNERISVQDWNFKKQRPKTKSHITYDGTHLLSELLENLKNVCVNAYRAEKRKGIPIPDTLRKYLQDFLNCNLVNEKSQKEKTGLVELIDRFIGGQILNHGKNKSKSTLSNYKTTKKHLEAYMLKEKCKLSFDDITLNFFYSYTGFLKKAEGRNGKQLSHNTIATDIKNIKFFMNEAVDLKYTNNLEFKHKKFSMAEVESDSIYLSEPEIIKLYNHDLTDNLRLEQVRDLFVFGCFVGLRFSDYSTVEKDNIVDIDGDRFLKIIATKTSELVIIPCNNIVLEIFEKYKANDNNLPKASSNQKFNEYIKEACQNCGLIEKGRLPSAPQRELYKCITSHTARRSFATNLYLDGYPLIEIMKITGHKTEKSFLKYIKIEKQDAAKRLSKFMKMRWEEKTQKACKLIEK